MDVIEIAASAIERDPMSVSDTESNCRLAVARAMREGGRLLAADEVEDIVGDVVSDETYVDIDSVEPDGGGEVELTDAEWESVDSDDKVVYGDTVGMVVGGRFCPVRIVEDTRAAHISYRISKSMEYQAHVIASLGIDERSLYHPIPDVAMPCPRCASSDVTPVWFDGGEVIACCNDCGCEFDASVSDVMRATLADRTVEDIDILPEHDIFGSVWCSDGGRFGYEVYASGELVDSGEEDTFEDVQGRFDDIADAYEDISEGAVIDLTNGGSEVIECIDGDKVTMEGGRTASRARLARMMADGIAYADRSGVASAHVREGQRIALSHGRLADVVSVGSDGVYLDVYEGVADGRVACRQVRLTMRQLSDMMP